MFKDPALMLSAFYVGLIFGVIVTVVLVSFQLLFKTENLLYIHLAITAGLTVTPIDLPFIERTMTWAESIPMGIGFALVGVPVLQWLRIRELKRKF